MSVNPAQTISSITPLFARTENAAWQPSAFAHGPFEGLQGGGVAALTWPDSRYLSPLVTLWHAVPDAGKMQM